MRLPQGFGQIYFHFRLAVGLTELFRRLCILRFAQYGLVTHTEAFPDSGKYGEMKDLQRVWQLHGTYPLGKPSKGRTLLGAWLVTGRYEEGMAYSPERFRPCRGSTGGFYG